jgi:hypothetical protein
VRFTVRAFAVLIGLLAFLMAGFLWFSRRPYPTGVVQQARSGSGVRSGTPTPEDTLTYQLWSDGWWVRADAAHATQDKVSKLGPLLKVIWSDGTVGWYWRGLETHPHSLKKLWDGAQTWHYPGAGGIMGARDGPHPLEKPPNRP